MVGVMVSAQVATSGEWSPQCWGGQLPLTPCVRPSLETTWHQQH